MSFKTVRRVALLGALAISTASCAGDPVTTSPSGQSLFTPQFGGNWNGTAVLSNVGPVVNGECVGPALQAQIGTSAGTENVTLAVTQDSDAITARLASATSGLACTYKGTTAQNTLALDAASCDAPMLIIRCGPTGPVRQMLVIGSTVQGTVSGGRVSGTLSNAYNVFDEKGEVAVTRVTLNYQFNAAKP